MKLLSRSRLLEAKDPEGKDWDIVVIEAGLGKNNRFYPAQVLKKAKSLYQHVPVYLFKLKDTADHLPDQLASIKSHLLGNQVGFLEDPRFGEFKADGQTKKGILARLHIDAGAKSLRAKLLDWWKHGVIDRLGLSHDAGGDTTTDPITEIETVDEIKEVSSVELVDFPAQGGQFLRLLASQGGMTMFENLEKALFSILQKLDQDLVEGIDEETITEDQFLEMLEAGVENENFYTEAKALEEKGPFMQGILSRLLKLLQAAKKDQAVKLIVALRGKLKKYGYPQVAGYYGYPAPVKAAEEPTLDELFPEDIDESAYTDCMKEQIPKLGFKKAAAFCKIKAKKKESGNGDTNKGDKGDEDPTKQALERIASLEAQLKKEPSKEALERIASLEAQLKKEPSKEALERIAKIEENAKKSASAAVLEEALSASDLFEPVKEKVRSQFKGRIFEKKELEESIKTEKDVLAKLSESGNLKGLGQTKVQVSLAEADKHQIAMDLLLGVEVKDTKGVPPFRGLKEAYRTFNPKDPDVTFQQPKNLRITEATLTPSSFAYALGVSITRKFVKLYKLLDLPWREFVNIVPIDNFKEQERIRWGGFGELPTVDVDGPYVDIAHPTDEKAFYSAFKKGGLFAIARETIKNDDMNMLRQVPTRLARAAARTLSAFVWAFLKDNPTIYDGATLFNAARGNLGSAALDYDSLSDARTAMKSMRERGNKVEDGTADAGGANNELVDATKSWGVNDYQNYYVRIIYGTGVGQYRLISSNDATTLTLATNWTTNPDATSKYEISQYLDDKVGLKPAYLAFPTELEAIAEAILTSEYIPFVAERTRNVLRNLAKPMSPPQLTDPNDWYLIADKTWIDLLEIGFIDGKEDPTVLVQDAPGVGAVFTNDRITYKVRHEYGGAVIDYRGFYKAVVA